MKLRLLLSLITIAAAATSEYASETAAPTEPTPKEPVSTASKETEKRGHKDFGKKRHGEHHWKHGHKNLTPEQRAERRKRWAVAGLTPEQRMERKKKWAALTPEQREEKKKQWTERKNRFARKAFAGQKQ